MGWADGGFQKQYPVLPVETVSTIGAGDNFNAGIVYGMIKEGITRQEIEGGLSESQWDHVIQCGMQFSAECCRSINNSVSVEFGNKRKKELEAALAAMEE